MAQEIELKLVLSPDQVSRLKQSAPLLGLKPQRRMLESVYYDTPDFALFKQGVALRVRKAGRRWIQTVKAESASLGALSSRPEWEVDVAGGKPEISRLPEAAQAFFPAELRARLKPCFSTRFERTAWLIEDASGAMELALDSGEIRAGRRRVALSEVEIELISGKPEGLFDLAERLSGSVAFQLEPRSKAERGYALAGAYKPAPAKARPPKIAAGDSSGDIWRAMAAAALAQLSANVPGVSASDDVEYVHQMRVAIRRLLAVAGLAKAMGLPRPNWRRGLSDLMDELAAAREWDVFAVELLPSLEGLSDTARAELSGPARRRQVRERGKARAALRSPGFVSLMLAMGRDLAMPGEAKGSSRRWAETVLDRRYKRLRKLGKGFERLDAKGRHRVRIAAKKLRYVADALSPLYGDKAMGYIEQLSRLQDKLGAANDGAIALRQFAELKMKGPRADTVRVEFERALGQQLVVREQGIVEGWRELLAAPPFWREPSTPN